MINPLKIREYLLKHEGFKEFGKAEFAGYAGAEKFIDDSLPIIKSTDDFDIIFDKDGFSFESPKDNTAFNLDLVV